MCVNKCGVQAVRRALSATTRSAVVDGPPAPSARALSATTRSLDTRGSACTKDAGISSKGQQLGLSTQDPDSGQEPKVVAEPLGLKDGSLGDSAAKSHALAFSMFSSAGEGHVRVSFEGQSEWLVYGGEVNLSGIPSTPWVRVLSPRYSRNDMHVHKYIETKV